MGKLKVKDAGGVFPARGGHRRKAPIAGLDRRNLELAERGLLFFTPDEAREIRARLASASWTLAQDTSTKQRVTIIASWPQEVQSGAAGGWADR